MINISDGMSGITPEKVSALADYSNLLKEKKILFRRVGPYLQVNELPSDARWLIDLSIISLQLSDFLVKVLPVLWEKPCAYRIPFDQHEAGEIILGKYGYNQFSRVITIGAESELDLVQLADELVQLTKVFRGADIPGTSLLGGVVYARWGSFNRASVEKIFVLPAEANWPFQRIAEPIFKVVKKNMLKNSFRHIEIIKPNYKGDVIKAAFFKNIFNMGLCVIKEGRKNTFLDEFGRDVRDRIIWQFKLHKILEKHIRVPKAIELFWINEDVYFAMQLIKGRSLNEVVSDIQNFCAWWQLSIDRKMELLCLLLQVVMCISKMHQLGYLHRDLSPENFMVRGKDVFVIDLELAYDFKNIDHFPPYQWGTLGFRPTSDVRVANDTYTSYDVYGLGALMLFFFTGFSPVRLDFEHVDSLYDKLRYFIKDNSIAEIIVACFKLDGNERPSVDDIHVFLDNCRKTLQDVKSDFVFNPELEINIVALLQRGIGYFNRYEVLSTELIWVSKFRTELQADPTISLSPGFFSGVSGGLFLMANCKKMGLNIEKIKEVYFANLEYLKKICINKKEVLACGLNGVGGIVIALVTCIEEDVFGNKDELVGLLEKLLEISLKGISVQDGVAGYGLAILHAKSLLGEAKTKCIVLKCAMSIIQQQNNNGGWELELNNGTKFKRMNGYLYGVCGVVYFLWRAAEVYRDERLILSAKKGTNWLITNVLNAERSSGTFRSLDILFCLLAGYKVCGEVIYRYLIEQELRNLPNYIHVLDTSYESGISGLGDLYLEAWFVFGDDMYKKRAELIVEQISQLEIVLEYSCSCWKMEEFTLPSIELLTGNGGILYFLLRYYLSTSECTTLLL